MASLDILKAALRQKVKEKTSSPIKPLSDTQYSDGFDILVQDLGWRTYQDFIIPQLSQLLKFFLQSPKPISILEIGPGPKSVLGYLPGYLRRKISRYTAFEPNNLFATRLTAWIDSTCDQESPLPCLQSPAEIRRISFTPDYLESGPGAFDGDSDQDNDKYNVVLFCHSMYGMTPKREFIERSLQMLVEQPQSGMVVIFHRKTASLHLEGLVCHRTASYPDGVICVANDDASLDNFTPIIAGFIIQDSEVDKVIRTEWRDVCRALGHYEDDKPNYLSFSAADLMLTFTRHATALPEVMLQVPVAIGDVIIKNREARLRGPACIFKPTEIRHVQSCVQWALKYEFGLTIIGGGHSNNCIQPHVVAINMDAFNQIHVLPTVAVGSSSGSDSPPFIVAEAGCKTGEIIRKAMLAGLSVPLGSRPSVGAGMWLQGGIGHLARLHGLAVDAIVGAVVVSVESGEVFCIGYVPDRHWPARATRPQNEEDLLWAVKGAGTNFGIVISVTLQTYPAPTYIIRKWIRPLNDELEAWEAFNRFDRLVAQKLPRDTSADAYLFWDGGRMHLGVTVIESSTANLTSTSRSHQLTAAVWGQEDSFKIVDGIGLFETDMYMLEMHDGHSSRKTSSFKRCLLLKNVGAEDIAGRLVVAVRNRPSPFCYLHLLQGGGAVSDIEANATAFGCRDWHFACVITGVWPRDQDGTESERAAVRWVYDVAKDLLPLSSGAYGADLGSDPRDAALAVKAFGPNGPRLTRLKQNLDPQNILAYTCPFQRVSREPKLIILITGKSGAGKDYCAEIWLPIFKSYARKTLRVHSTSISDATKREYAAATGTNFHRLSCDRVYKEQHRTALTAFFEEQVRQRPGLPEEHFRHVVSKAGDVDVLLVTGMRDHAPVANLSHLVPDARLIEVRILACEQTRWFRRGKNHSSEENDDENANEKKTRVLQETLSDERPSFIFANDTPGPKEAERFAEESLLPFFDEDLQQLATMVHRVTEFPRPGIDFCHVLGISQQPGGLALCASLLRSHFMGNWNEVDAVTCCEAGGFIYASVLASQVNVPLVLIRKAGKLPPPTLSVKKRPSYISTKSLASRDSEEEWVEMERDVMARDASVVVVDDVLSTGETLCAMLELLKLAGVRDTNVSVLVVAEFPLHRGRKLLCRRGFGRVGVQSLLVMGGE